MLGTRVPFALGSLESGQDIVNRELCIKAMT